MNKLTFYPIAVIFFLVMGIIPATAQFNVKINVLNGSATTTCTDPIGSPDPQWAVNIDNAGWVVYPFNGLCYTNFPNEQFNQTYACLTDIPPTIPVCFRAFENDASLFDPCNPVFSCQAELCINVPVPPTGTVPFTITLPAGGPSGGNVNMNIAVSGVPGGVNDLICNAIPLGLLQTNVPVGFADTSIFNNFCATNVNEPNPGTFGIGWVNNRGVWFTFTTGPNPTAEILITANNDPSNFGDPINLQVAIFGSSNNGCTGTFSFLKENHEPTDWNESILFSCPQPNTTYYILVDGVQSPVSQVEGWFGLEVEQLDVIPASQYRCTTEDIGTVPLGGSVSTQLRTNACSMNADMMPATAFGVQKSVWFTFTPPPTGHVIIQGTSSPIDDIGLQLAVYESSDNNCTGLLIEFYSQTTAADLDETMELHCLDPNNTYFLLVDGALSNLNSGIFSLTITDAGNETPTTNLSPTLCFGETFSVGNNTYTQSGIYNDTLQLPGGCDSIVVTNLIVLTELQLGLQIINQGIGLGNTDGQMQVSPSGGAGGYSVVWSDGQTGNLATNLIGGNNYCVELTDANGCQADTCFIMPYYINFLPSVTGSSLACFGDLTGTIEFSAIGGVPPYQFQWQNQNNTVSGSGLILVDGEVMTLTGLPGGQYSIHLSDIVFDTTVFVEIVEPTELAVATNSISNVTCFGGCNGSISLDISGGTPPYQVIWSNGAANPVLNGLCADVFNATVSDANGCSALFNQEITEPPLFTAIATEEQAVSCFQGNDGIAKVTVSENAQTYIWSNGEMTSTISGLPGGTYSVTATNTAGCTATASVTITSPTAPVGVGISELQGIVCKGDNTGELKATATGPGNNFTFFWSNGAIQATASDLLAGNYTVTITNENGCTASASANLTEPTEILATFTTNTITCLDPENAGIITIDQVTGGLSPYSYSTDGNNFGQGVELGGYLAGLNNFYVLDAGGCVRTFQATIDGPAELLVDLGNDKTIDLGDSIKLQLSASQTGLTYEWSPVEGLSCTDCSSPVAAPFTSIGYTVTVTNTDGCTATDDVFITVNNNQKVFVPNAFSPNGDGFNDEFFPFTGGSVKTIKTFSVFDRQGNQVFEINNIPPNLPGTGWDGDFRGKKMQPAVFVWLAEIEFVDGKVQVYKGDVVLVR